MRTLEFLWLFAAGSLALSQASTLPCVLAALSSYDGSGFACTEDAGALTFSNFRFSETGSVSLPDSSIDLTPNADGFDIQAAFTAGAGSNLDVLLSYTVSDPSGLLSDGVTMAGFGASGTGAVNIAETVCLGAGFASGICPTGHEDTLNVFANAGGSQASDTVNFSAPLPTVIGLEKDISVIGGAGLSGGSVSLIDNLTTGQLLSTATPEPPTLLIGGAMIAVGLCRRYLRR